MSDRLAGRRILVTGGASGIGRACVARFRGEGARVALLDRDRAATERCVAELGRDGLVALPADAAAPDEVNAAVAAAADGLGGLDGVVACAGIDMEKPLADLSDEDWALTLGVNLTAPMLVSRAALPHLRRQGGTIVIVTSAAGLVPVPGRSAYCAAKAGAIMLAKALAVELAPERIRVNAVCPGAVDTPLLRSSWETKPDPQAARAAIEARYALKRIAAPGEIADAVLWLTSAESSYVTGTAVAVDGGRSFH
ncbi:SDR family NAD(P)-dependent oxidoreductase [Chelatococcus sp. SYSU_G07232]|uniref:SDR family NAD(P)-dependent oxidoreductase n=1 Tax=Chelatococcus albus TaxID=3047466 RepID=A0ABT7AJN7_9HYPH|nr:SDR family NAD(P)-dependent oxidoreductase [Chelatococcus sp. SYSU_G07232]MDJ1159591.1 SDR family NAD(P)-dependent oxidoreductase [Chelatococcus sp. SYSU_G07232]